MKQKKITGRLPPNARRRGAASLGECGHAGRAHGLTGRVRPRRAGPPSPPGRCRIWERDGGAWLCGERGGRAGLLRCSSSRSPVHASQGQWSLRRSRQISRGLTEVACGPGRALGYGRRRSLEQTAGIGALGAVDGSSRRKGFDRKNRKRTVFFA